ncbi:MAG TPA: hypothetical protein PKY50_20075 [Candidatus Competibacter sp.]|nr:hypothetical protein [Candidatus Competibacter sp.]
MALSLSEIVLAVVLLAFFAIFFAGAWLFEVARAGNRPSAQPVPFGSLARLSGPRCARAGPPIGFALLVFEGLYVWLDPFGLFALWGGLQARCLAVPDALALGANGVALPVSACAGRYFIAVFQLLLHGLVWAGIVGFGLRGFAGSLALALAVPTLNLWWAWDFFDDAGSAGPSLEVPLLQFFAGMMVCIAIAFFVRALGGPRDEIGGTQKR